MIFEKKELRTMSIEVLRRNLTLAHDMARGSVGKQRQFWCEKIESIEDEFDRRSAGEDLTDPIEEDKGISDE